MMAPRFPSLSLSFPVLGFLLILTQSAVRAQLTISGDGAVVQESIGRSVTLTCTYFLTNTYTLRLIKWYSLMDGDRVSVLVYYPGQSVYTYGLYRNRASLVNTDAAAQVASLRLTNLQFSDNGTYECVVGASSASGSGAPQEASAEIELVALVAPNDPVIDDDYDSATGNLTLTCTAYTGNPAAYLTWNRDGSPTSPDRADNITSWRGYLDAQSTIIVTANSAQSSTFECVAQHPAFTSARRVSVTLGSPSVSYVSISPNPTPEDPLLELDDVILTCMTQEGIVPQPTYEWRHDGGSLPTSAQAYGNDLKIFSAQVEDSGTYTCTASNLFGSDSGVATILIAGRDGSSGPETGHDGSSAPETEATLTLIWLGPGVVAGAAVGCFIGGLVVGGAAVFLLLRFRTARNDGGQREVSNNANRQHENVVRPRVASQRPGSGSDEYEVPMETVHTPPQPPQATGDYQELTPAIYQSLQKH